MFRTVQEALNNVVKHAGVSEAEVSLVFGEREVRAVVRDRGRGFDPSVARSGGFGLAGMRERIEARGGTITVASAPGSGTTVTAGLPLAAEE
jgi:two-component system, NarL family, sensor histidine kinase DegS